MEQLMGDRYDIQEIRLLRRGRIVSDITYGPSLTANERRRMTQQLVAYGRLGCGNAFRWQELSTCIIWTNSPSLGQFFLSLQRRSVQLKKNKTLGRCESDRTFRHIGSALKMTHTTSKKEPAPLVYQHPKKSPSH